MRLLEGVGDVLEEDQAEDDVLVLGGVHVAAELVGQPQSFASKPRLAPLPLVFLSACFFCRATFGTP